MREILFRGKRKDTGEWIEGQYYKRTYYYGDSSVKHYIIESTEHLSYDQALEYYEVIPETVGQFTGLLDKNGVKIFEGDIVGEYLGIVDLRRRYKAEFIPDRGGWYPFASGDGCGCCESETITPNNHGIVGSVKVIGNIHDNP